jgi:hypothetical protein
MISRKTPEKTILKSGHKLQRYLIMNKLEELKTAEKNIAHKLISLQSLKNQLSETSRARLQVSLEILQLKCRMAVIKLDMIGLMKGKGRGSRPHPLS